MEKIRNLFFHTKMTWPRVILFAVAVAVVTAALLSIPLFNDTSVENIGVTFECWIFFALIIILNCEKPLEAGAKTFVFFLISQPLIYLLQVPFNPLGWQIFMYYPRWLVLTVLCFPGGVIAWFVKKDNLPGSLILSVATGFLAVECIYFLNSCINNPPKYLLSAVFCAALAVVMIFALLHERKNRIIAGAITLAAAIIMCCITFSGSKTVITNGSFTLDEGHVWEVTETDGKVGRVQINPYIDNMVLIDADRYGTETVTLTNENGENVVLTVSYDEADGLIIRQE